MKKAKKRKYQVIYRSAITGRFVTRWYAENCAKWLTVKERVKYTYTGVALGEGK